MDSGQEFVEDVFEAALAVPPEERSAFLSERCKGAPELRRAVELLLAADAQAGSFLDHPFFPPPPDEAGSSAEPAYNVDGEEESSAFRVGMTVAGRFTIHRFIARGGMGEVWEAWDAQVEERVALKTVRPDLARHPEMVERFRREVKQARAISNPNVCRIHEMFSIETQPGTNVLFLCMEFLEGPVLSEYLRHHGPFEPSAAYGLVKQLIHGLNSAHAQGVVHRDLKSRNIMLVNSGPGRIRAVITDFGLALNVLAPEGWLEERKGQGTPDYMAPEQRVTGKVTALADQYALGVVMCEMLTGARPVRSEGRPSGVMGNLRLPPQPVPPRWAHVLQRCLAARPEDRFPNLDEILTCLDPPRRRRWVWGVAAAACLVTLGGGGWVRLHRPVEPTSLAVLPLHNESGDHRLDYLGVGMTEALTNDLAGMPGLQVKAEGIAAQYSAEKGDAGELGKRLKVSSLVSGSFTSQNGHLQIPVEVIDVANGSHIWGKTYEGDVANLAELQNEISTDVAYHLKIRLNPDLKARLKRQYTTVPAAYDAYLQGRYRLTLRSPDDLREAIAAFQKALDADPHYAPAYAGLADGYNLMAHYGTARQIPMMRNALKAADQALELDPTLGEAYASRALARTWLNYEWTEAESDYLRALELNPSYLNAHIWYALALLAPLGRDHEAEGQLSYAEAADPDSLLTTISLAMVAQCGGREAQSARILEGRFKTIEHFEPAVDLLASDYLALRRPNDAIALLEKAEVGPGEEKQRAISLSVAHAQAGNIAEAAKWFQSATSDDAAKESFPYETALYYNSLGNHAKAMDALESAYLRRDPDLLFVNVDPLLASLHSVPRFKVLLHHMQLQ